jgi:hypothetical protein
VNASSLCRVSTSVILIIIKLARTSYLALAVSKLFPALNLLRRPSLPPSPPQFPSHPSKSNTEVPPAVVATYLVTQPTDLRTFFTASGRLEPSCSPLLIHGTPTGAPESLRSKSTSIPSISQYLLPPVRSIAGLTRSKSLFSIYMGLDARVPVIDGSDEFYLFMDLRAEQRWVSYNCGLPEMASCNA